VPLHRRGEGRRGQIRWLHSVALMCRVMGINRSTYYAWLASQPSAAERRRAEDELAGGSREIHATSRGAYGVPRVHAELRRKGHVINRKRSRRIMRERDIRGITRRRRRHLTRQDTKAAPAPDLVGRDFTAEEPGTKLVGDITYLATIEGWWYPGDRQSTCDSRGDRLMRWPITNRAELVNLRPGHGRRPGRSAARLHYAYRPRQRVHQW